MKSKFVLSLLSLIILTAMVLGTGSVQAEETAPPPEDYWRQYDPSRSGPMDQDRFYNPTPIFGEPEGSRQSMLNLQEIRSEGGPDEFGYIWNDSEAFSWIDAAGEGTNIGLYGGDVYHPDPVDIGFVFPFYNEEYSELYVSTKGMVTLSGPGMWWNVTSIPTVAQPNNFIAPMWADLGMFTDGSRPDAGIFVMQGGTAPDRFFVVEWHRADVWYGGQYEDSTFQVVLHENGDIVFQYLSLIGNMKYNASVGIEDSEGIGGLQYLYNSPGLENGLAIRFSYPQPSKRVSLFPRYQGAFASAGVPRDFYMTLRNIGSLGVDSYTFSSNSLWTLSLYDEDGVTPISSPVELEQGDSVTLIARVTAPMNVQVGDFNTATVTATSSDTSKSRTVSLTSAVPAPFAMVMQDNGDGMGIGSYLVTPVSQDRNTFYGWGDAMAVAELPNRNQIYAWNEWRCVEWGEPYCLKSVGEIKYAIRDRFGNEVLPPTILADLSAAQNEPRDLTPALAVAPNGNIGVIWNRIRYRQESGVWKYNYNIHFAVLDQNGGVVANPSMITSDQNFRNWEEVGYVNRYDPKITASEDGRFSFVWTAYRRTASGYVRNVLFGIRGNQGGLVNNPVLLTDSVENTRYFESPTITAVSGNKVFITWRRVDITQDGQYQYWDFSLSSSVRDSSGAIVKAVINIPNTRVWNPAAALLSDGNIILAGSEYNHITYLLFDGNTFNPLNGQVFLPDPDGFYGQKFMTITGDPDGHVVLTWMYDPYAWQGRPSTNLFYALLENDGSVVTPAMPFYAAVQSEWGGQPHVRTGRSGQGHTTYHYSFSPYFTSTPPTEVIEGDLYSYSITVDDPDLPDETLSITAITKPDWLNFTDHGNGTATLSGTPAASDVGDHDVVLDVTDSFFLSEPQAFSVSVLLREPPVITSNSSTIFAIGLENEFIITASGVPLPEFVITQPLPSSLELTNNGGGTATLAGIPDEGTEGSYALTITASNGGVPDSVQNFTLTIGSAPTIESPSTATFSVEKEGLFTVTTTGVPVPALIDDGTWPDGVEFTDNGNGTGEISGTPSQGSAGVYQAALTADNGTGYPAEQIFTLIVKDEEVIGSDGGRISSHNNEIQITVSAGTVADDTRFILTPQLVPSEGVPGSLSYANVSFTLTVDPPDIAMPFDPPITVRIEYDAALLEDMPEDSLMLYYWTGSEWQDAAYEGVYIRSNTSIGEYWFEVEIDHLTEFAVMGRGGSEVFLPLILR